MNFTDAVTVAGTRRTEDGYLIAEARAVRTGIQDYAGHEVGKPEMAIVKVYRPADSVFADASLQSFTHAPVTNDHPTEQVTSDNWKSLAVGEVSTAAKKDGEWVMLPLILKDAAAIKLVEDGKRELSAGYVCELDWTPGKTADGAAYDAVQKNIKINHLALVDRARAGSKARIGDGAEWGAAPITATDTERNLTVSNPTTRMVVVGDEAVEATDATARVIERMKAEDRAKDQRFADAEKAYQKAIADLTAAKDEEIGALKAENKQLKDAQITPEAFRKQMSDRLILEKVAVAIVSDLKPDTLTDAEVRRAVVKSKLGDEMVKDASDAEISGMFKAIAKDVKPTNPDPFARVVADGINTAVNDDDAGKAYMAMVADMQNAHLPKTA